MSKNTIFNNKYIGWILFIMVVAGYSAYWVDNNRDFNTVIFDENNKVRDIEYIATEYHKLFKDTDWENMPEFKLVENENSDIHELFTIFTNNNLIYLTLVQSLPIENTVGLANSIEFPIDNINSIENIVTNLKAGFEILEKAYPKDGELLDKIYTEIPMHFTKYTNQENYQDTKYKQVYTNTLEKETVVIDYIHIYIINKTYTVSVIKTLYKKEKENVKK